VTLGLAAATSLQQPTSSTLSPSPSLSSRHSMLIPYCEPVSAATLQLQCLSAALHESHLPLGQLKSTSPPRSNLLALKDPPGAFCISHCNRSLNPVLPAWLL
jgi:hypothetical protein